MTEILTQNLTLFVALSAVFGLLVGSFLNVVVHRLPKMMERAWREECAWLQAGADHDKDDPADRAPPEHTGHDRYDLFLPASACPHCGHLIRWYENVPVISWLALRGRCSQCTSSISMRYPLVEALTGAVFAIAAYHWGFSVEVLWVWLLLGTLIALTFIDFDTHLLPDSLTLPLVWLGLLANYFGVFCTLEEAVIGAMAGYLSLWLIYHLFKLLTGKEGMGYGDFKLLAALGAWLGWKLLLPVVLLASLAGAIVGIGLMLLNRQGRSQPMPFGPWLAMGGAISVFWGTPILHFWLG